MVDDSEMQGFRDVGGTGLLCLCRASTIMVCLFERQVYGIK
jgi:hypothetical protein